MLHQFLKDRGYEAIDDFYHLSRDGKVPIWQSTSIVTINVLAGGKAIYETDEDIDEFGSTPWNQLHCEYLLATLPREFLGVFVREIELISHKFQLSVLLNDQQVTIPELSAKINVLADEMTGVYGEPGAKEVRIAIEELYRRP
jgi:hypothetical protein